MKFFRLSTLVVLLSVLATTVHAQYWQQRIDYKIQTYLEPSNHQYFGEQVIDYTNNSPDTLNRIYIHLYPNAFQPGSMMDQRNLSLPDADKRVGDRISKLSKTEIGFLKIDRLTQGNSELDVKTEGTIAVVDLKFPIYPNKSTNFKLNFSGQVPLQIRRSGRDNKEGIDYSMPQWYPKVSEYDYQGWHPNPYVGREFHGVWGDFDVTVALPSNYVFAGTGYEQPFERKFYDKKIRKKLKKGDYKAHRRVAPDVHDFTWAADTEYTSSTLERADGTVLEFYYVPGENTSEKWKLLPNIMDEALNFLNKQYGKYPYKKYAFIQGGDGGMEYAMCTLITGERSLKSLVGVSVHEMVHSWYQFVLGTNESLYPWMDEGFTSFVSAEVMNHLKKQGLLPGVEPVDNPYEGLVMGISRFINAGRSEALSTHADHFTTNAAYGVGSYSKGELFLYQLRGVIGDKAFYRGMRRYYNTWKMKHPTPNDFIRIMEKESGQVLDWYLEYMINTTHQIDYAVDSIYSSGKNQTTIILAKEAPMPYPIDVKIKDTNGEASIYLIPTVLQRGHAPLEGRVLNADWPWTHPKYKLELPIPMDRLESVEIDPMLKMSEADKTNNLYPEPQE